LRKPVFREADGSAHFFPRNPSCPSLLTKPPACSSSIRSRP
jgi:hypothetical protein